MVRKEVRLEAHACLHSSVLHHSTRVSQFISEALFILRQTNMVLVAGPHMVKEAVNLCHGPCGMGQDRLRHTPGTRRI
jgi:hypothetical protein